MRFFKTEKGWGAISSPELPDDYDPWVHSTMIDGVGYRNALKLTD